MDQDRSNGFEVKFGDLAVAVSSALDLVSPVVAGHHLRVARIARAIARQLGFTRDQMQELLLAAAFHDCGAFSLRERLDIMQYDVRNPGDHAATGFRLLKSFPHFERAAEIVRFHHLPWEYRRGEQWRGQPVPPASHLLHLADRVSVLTIDRSGVATWPGVVAQRVRSGSGSLFNPVFVEALAAASARPGFWLGVAAAGDDDVRSDPAFGDVILSAADLRSLARLFWQIVDFRTPFTATHTCGVAAVAESLALLTGVGGATGRNVALAAGLHDIGKLAVASETLEKERNLTRQEVVALRNHPLHGWRVLEKITGLGQINRWANCHHERLDGLGYPFQLTAAQLPLESRIVAVADVFTALTEERPYRRGMSGREAAGILGDMAAGGALDYDIVALVARNREAVASIRRQAQERAAGRYRACREHAPDTVSRSTAA